MSSEMNTLAEGNGDSHPGFAAALRVAKRKKPLDSDETGEHFAFYEPESDRVAVYRFDGWEGVFDHDIDLYGQQVWSAPRSDLLSASVSTSD